MRNVLIVLMVFITAFSISCNDSCDEGNKPTPASFFVEIVEETSGENVFENTTYTAQQITIEDLDEVAIPYRFIQNSNIIQIFPSVVNATGNSFLIKLNNETTMQTNEINVNYDVSSSVGECFTTYKIENILFPNNTSELVEAVHVVKI
ncbi:MAG: hypothetical protein EKK56_00535 [Flavobacteriaceae bacterium]|jgi:hypothetical protein|uniref:hypothetical protein n=1 Tax=Flavobacterium sp. UBA6195 TaxID=1946554 RepID=UPI000F9F31C3|nr:hypothetical protein [Flavobacterium sp. UBA6195]RTL14663.1 MAG: hypothetical protein EKK56_00535 [Flavobacteriaceae bacterium]TXI69657.1 MAG: hypothetical protein E6Q45_03495 [Flavobacterium sp.]